MVSDAAKKKAAAKKAAAAVKRGAVQTVDTTLSSETTDNLDKQLIDGQALMSVTSKSSKEEVRTAFSWLDMVVHCSMHGSSSYNSDAN